MEALFEEAGRTVDNQEIIQEITKMISDEMLLIPVYNQMDTWITKPNVQGAEFTQWDAGTQYRPENAYFAQ